jgi:hypothetical protein
MNTKRFSFVLACLLGVGAVQCDRAMESQVFADSTSSAPAELPKGYETLAEILGLEMKSSPKLFRSAAPFNAPKVDADLRGAIMTMKDIHSDNEDVNYVASLASDAFNDTAHTLETIDATPKPGMDNDSFPLSSIILLAEHRYWSFFLSLANNSNKKSAQGQREKAEASVNQLAGDLDKIQTAMLLLPKIAAKYSAPSSPSEDQFKAIFVPAWGPSGPNDTLVLENNGPDLKNCTIIVDIQGAAGEAHENVHFVPSWPSHTPLLASYAHGQKIFGRMIGQLTFNQVSAATVTILSPSYSTQLHCTCDAATRDQQITALCKNLNITYHYTVRQGLLIKTNDGDLTMDGVTMLPACMLDLTMHNGTKSRFYHISLSPWKASERKTFPQLTFPADTIDVVLTFPNTSYRYQTTLHPQS